MIEPLRYSMVLGLLGAAFLALAAGTSSGGRPELAWAFAGVEGYCGVSLLALAVAYALQHRGVAVERGFQHPVWARGLDALLLPYRVLAWAVVAVARRVDPMEPMHAVGARIYVGRRPHASERARMAAAGVTSVVNLCLEFPVRGRVRHDPRVETVYLPMLDGTAPSSGQFETAVDWISRRHAEGHTVLIHCAQGRGRSVTVAAAALCRLGLAAGPDDALALIRAARPKAKPSRQQRSALARFVGAGPAPAECPPAPVTTSLS
jgi:hypothetical protein